MKRTTTKIAVILAVAFAFCLGISSFNPAVAGGHDTAVMIELMIGFDSDGIYFDTPGVGLRVVHNNFEAHAAQWWNSDDDPIPVQRAFGLGYNISTEGKGTRGNDDTHASWTPGLALVLDGWTPNKDTPHIYNRFNVGTEIGRDFDVELGAVFYGLPHYDFEAAFWTLGLRYNDRVDNDPVLYVVETTDTDTDADTDGDTGDGDTDDGDNGDGDNGDGDNGDGDNGDGDNGNGNDGDRPGHGYGDDNHDHTGPPGHGDTRPGNGYGDDNHDHTGPPGQCKKE